MLWPIILMANPILVDMTFIVQGGYEAFRKTLEVAKLIILIILIWSLCGFFVYRREYPNINSSHFESFRYSTYTVTHCTFSRPSVPVVLTKYFSVFNSMALFFVTLTLSGDMLCTARIAAISIRYYRDYALLVFKSRLRYRYDAITAIFLSYSTSSPTSPSSRSVTVENWISFCLSLKGAYALHDNNDINKQRHHARMLFALQDKNQSGNISKLGFFRLCALLACRVELNDVSTKANTAGISADKIFNINPMFVAPEKNETIKHLGIKFQLKFDIEASSSIFLRWYSFTKKNSLRIARSRLHFFGKAFHPFSFASLVSYILLIVQMSLLSQINSGPSSNNDGLIALGLIVLAFFFIKNLVYYLSSITSQYVTLKDLALNVAILIV